MASVCDASWSDVDSDEPNRTEQLYTYLSSPIPVFVNSPIEREVDRASHARDLSTAR